jgi:hypothetical protein
VRRFLSLLALGLCCGVGRAQAPPTAQEMLNAMEAPSARRQTGTVAAQQPRGTAPTNSAPGSLPQRGTPHAEPTAALSCDVKSGAEVLKTCGGAVGDMAGCVALRTASQTSNPLVGTGKFVVTHATQAPKCVDAAEQVLNACTSPYATAASCGKAGLGFLKECNGYANTVCDIPQFQSTPQTRTFCLASNAVACAFSPSDAGKCVAGVANLASACRAQSTTPSAKGSCAAQLAAIGRSANTAASNTNASRPAANSRQSADTSSKPATGGKQSSGGGRPTSSGASKPSGSRGSSGARSGSAKK